MRSDWSSKLQSAIRAAVENAGDRDTADSIAAVLLRKEAKLIEAWVHERIIFQVRKELKRQPDSRQGVFFGFRSLRLTLSVRGEKVPMLQATVTELRKAAAGIRLSASKHSPKAMRLDKLADEMAAKKIRGLTVERFHAMQSVGAEGSGPLKRKGKS